MTIRPVIFASLLFGVVHAAGFPAFGWDQPSPQTSPPVSFLKDLAPVLVRNCIACHNPKKSEGKYVMTTFAQLARGGVAGEGINLEPGDADASYFVELCRIDGEPRMPYKLDPLPSESIALIERWVKEGAKYDGVDPTEEWLVALRKASPVIVPENYPAPVPITALAFSPDGSKLVASGYHEVTAWGILDGKLDRRTGGLAERTHAVAFSPDGKWFATAGGDPGQYGSVRLFAVNPDGASRPTYEIPTSVDAFLPDDSHPALPALATAVNLIEMIDSAFAVAFSPDSTKLAAAGADRAVRIWDVLTGAEIMTIEDHADWVFDLAWSPDGKRIATASRDKTSKVFDVQKKEVLATFPGHADIVYAVRFAPDGKSVVSGGNDHQIRVWNPDEDAKQIRAVGGFNGAIFRLAFSPDGKMLAATGDDKVVRVFEDYTVKHNLAGHADWVYSLAFTPDGKTLASGGWDGEVRLWTLPDGKPGRQFVAAPGIPPATATVSK